MQPGQQEIKSARLRRLRDQLDDGPDGVATFWAEIEEQGTPLIEAVEETPNVRLVTFLWRETEPTANVVLFEWFSEGDTGQKQLTKPDGSDVWNRSSTLTSDLRVTYTFLVNDSLIPVREDPNLEEHFKKAILDPLNPDRIVQSWMTIKKDGFGRDASIASLPDAPAFVWKGLRDVPHGNVTTRRFTSTLLENEHDISIYTYPGYDVSTDEATLLIEFDGDECLGVLDVANLVDNLQSEGRIRPTVAVFVGNVERGEELPCNETFANFLADELIPWMRANYRIAPGPESVIASGQSNGGLASAWVGLTRPDAVGNVLSQSGSYWWVPQPEQLRGELPIGAAPLCGWLPEQVTTWDRVPTRFYMEAGRLEAGGRGPIPSLLGTNRHMCDVLIAKGYDVTYSEYGGGHDWFKSAELMANGLLHLNPAADAHARKRFGA